MVLVTKTTENHILFSKYRNLPKNYEDYLVQNLYTTISILFTHFFKCILKLVENSKKYKVYYQLCSKFDGLTKLCKTFGELLPV